MVAIDGSEYNVLSRGYTNFSDNRIRYFSIKVPSDVVCRFAYTINQAFRESKGKYITYLCHDDLYLPYRLQVMVKVMEKMNLDIVFGDQQLIDGIDPDNFWVEQVRKGSTEHPMGAVDHSSVMHRRECFEKVGGWDESAPMRYGDAFFWKRLLDAGYKFNGIAVVLDVHRFNKDSVTWKEDNPESKRDYPPFDDLGNKRTIESGVDAGWSAVEK
jgi:GT2 family glycosyltransferase